MLTHLLLVRFNKDKGRKMTPKQQAIADIYEGKQVRCTKKQYHTEVRLALHDAAGRWIDAAQDIRAIMALEEIKRLDELYKNST